MTTLKLKLQNHKTHKSIKLLLLFEGLRGSQLSLGERWVVGSPTKETFPLKTQQMASNYWRSRDQTGQCFTK